MLFRRKKGTWREIRGDYRDLPPQEWTEDEHAHFWATCSDEEYWATWEHWSREAEEHPRVKRIRQDVLDLAFEAAKSSHPQEFACLMRVEDQTITELVLLPGTVQGDEHAILDLWMQPVDRDVRGSLHSHPDEHPYPSDDDFELFAYQGEIHLILCMPYAGDAWRAYSHDGTPVRLEVVAGEARPDLDLADLERAGTPRREDA